MTEPNLLDRLIGKRFQQTRRDLRAITSGLQGGKPKPFTIKTGDGWPEIEPRVQRQKLRGEAVELLGRRMLTEDSVELTLAFTDRRALNATPGQFITLETTIDEQIVRRPYSLSRVDNVKGEFRVAVRHVPKGLMSTYLVHTEHSPNLTALGPSGDFGLASIDWKPKRALLIAAGSGVTPIRSMVEPILEQLKTSKVDLFLLNRDSDSSMYQNELQTIATQNPKRVTLTHWYSRGKSPKGRLTQDDFKHYLSTTYKRSKPDLIAICGPDSVQLLLEPILTTHFPEATLSLETFTPASSSEPSTRLGVQSAIEIVVGEKSQTITVEGEQSILDAGLEAGIELPFSCTVGGCGACIAKCTKGRVSMPALNALSESERADGMILTCVAQARGAATIEVGA
jgi:ring-1,2-phenylacetyl-CoA epoxidase subunit PaaE